MRAAIPALLSLLTALALAPSARAHEGGVPCAYDEFYPAADALDVSFLAASAMCQQVSVSEARDLSDERAQVALERATTATPPIAALHLDVAEAVHPRLADLFAVARGEALLEAGNFIGAESAFSEALETRDSEVLVRARVGRTLALLKRDHRDAEEAVSLLRRRYPELPEEAAVMLELGAYLERRDRAGDAAARYRWLQVQAPGTPQADVAAARIVAMRARGVDTRELAPIEVVTRAERLFARGPLSEARLAIGALEEAPPATRALRARAYALMAKLARHEGRFPDAVRYFALSERNGTFGDADDIQRRRDRAADLRRAIETNEDAARRLETLRRGRALRRVASARLLTMAYVAARGAQNETLHEVLVELARRELAPRHRVELVTRVMGAAESADLLTILAGTGQRAGSLGVKARYYEGRLHALEGNVAEAQSAFEDVVERDRSELTWYASWAAQMLQDLAAPDLEAPAVAAGEPVLASLPDGETPAADAAAIATDTPRANATDAPGSADESDDEDGRTNAPLKELAEALEDLDAAAYPWIARAAALLRLGDTRGAARQLYESYLAYRDANGRAIRRAGLASVAMGKSRLRPRANFQTRRERAALSAESVSTLREVAEAIGASGAAVGFGGIPAIVARPRAFADLVEAAAERHGIDPDLLLAVMRVESVYQPQIVSYAGAVGLAQIMPRTGTLIAHELDRNDFVTSDLLEPETNLDFAAWYLASLIERFDGHVPLAIASYNGGPHNVRRWLADHPRDLPLDAFLEHIPFEQTHRYVRRVLGHYEAYRAKDGLSMVRLATQLPTLGADPIGF